MENKVNQIIEVLRGEKITDCRTILQKVNLELNDKIYQQKQEMIF